MGAYFCAVLAMDDTFHLNGVSSIFKSSLSYTRFFLSHCRILMYHIDANMFNIDVD